jgi:hypothetical protein
MLKEYRMRDPNILLAVISGILGGSFLSFIQYLITRHDRRKAEAEERIDPKEFRKLVKLSIAEAQDRIYYLGKAYLAEGKVPLKEWSIYDEMYDRYADLGGNHYAQDIHDEVEKLPKDSS